MLSEKRAISAVVATVLLILITVAAVALIWAAVRPMLQKSSEGITAGCLTSNLKIDTVGATCYDSGTSTLIVGVSRGSEDFDMLGFQVIVKTAGSSNTTTFEVELEKNNAVSVNITGVAVKPSQISIAPIVQIGNTQKVCDITNTADVISICA